MSKAVERCANGKGGKIGQQTEKNDEGVGVEHG